MKEPSEQRKRTLALHERALKLRKPTEANELSNIYATIILNMRRRLERENEARKNKNRKQTDT